MGGCQTHHSRHRATLARRNDIARRYRLTHTEEGQDEEKGIERSLDAIKMCSDLYTLFDTAHLITLDHIHHPSFSSKKKLDFDKTPVSLPYTQHHLRRWEHPDGPGTRLCSFPSLWSRLAFPIRFSPFPSALFLPISPVGTDSFSSHRSSSFLISCFLQVIYNAPGTS